MVTKVEARRKLLSHFLDLEGSLSPEECEALRQLDIIGETVTLEDIEELATMIRVFDQDRCSCDPAFICRCGSEVNEKKVENEIEDLWLSIIKT